MVRIQLRRDTAANWVSANPTLRAGEIGIETDTLKMKVGNGTSTWTQITNYLNVTSSTLASNLASYIEVADLNTPGGPAKLDANGDLLVLDDSIVLFADTEYDYTTTISATTPTADRTITFPDSTGTVALTSDLSSYAPLSGATFTGNINVPTAIVFEGATADSYETTIQVTDPTADRTITVPNATGTLALTTDIPSLSIAQVNTGGTATETYNNITTLQFDEDSGFDVTNPSTGVAKVAMNSTFKYWEVDGVQKLTATGLDTVNFVSGTGVDITADGNADPQEITISVDTTAIQARVADVSDTEIGYLNGVTSAIQTQIDSKAPINNPTFTGTVTLAGAPTLNLQAATKKYVDDTVSGVIDGAPDLLNTLNELAAAINDDANYTTTLTTALGNKQDKVTNVSDTEIGYLDGVTSSIQTQIDAKQSIVSGVSDTEIGYLDGVTSSIQSQLDDKSTASKTETLTNKTLTTPVINGPTITATGQTPTIHGIYLPSPHTIIFEGTTADDFETTLAAGEPTADRTITLPDQTGTIQLRVTDVSDTEIGYLDGVTSSIQTQLDAKIAKSLVDAKGDLLVGSADNTVTRLGVGTDGYLLTADSSVTNGVKWAAAPVSLPDQTGNTGKYLTTDGTDASWAELVVPITTGTVTVNQNTAQDVDTTALSAFTSIEYMISIKQGSKVRTSKVIMQTDGTSVDMTEFAITETGGAISGVVVSAAAASSNGKLQVTVTNALSTNATVKFSKVAL